MRSPEHASESWPIQARFPDLAGKAAIVTGASRGIGCGIADVLAAQGMRLVLAARSEEEGTAFAGTLRAKGAECLWVTADLSSAGDAKRVVDAALEAYGAVDLLVNNAAALRSKAFLDLDEETYRRSFELNMRIVYQISLPVARRMAEGGRGGVIVNISSVGGLRAHRGKAGYDASKGAIDALTRAMAVDLAPDGIRVNAVAPGAIRSRRQGTSPRAAEHAQVVREGVPLGRFGRTEEIGAAVGFLASDAAAYITGQVIYVDGGLTAQLTPPGVNI